MTMLTRSERPCVVVPLTVRDIPALPVSWRSRLDEFEIRRCLEAAPGLSVWNPDTREYAIGGYWRHRGEVVHVADLSAIRHPDAMIRGVVEAAKEYGALLTVIVEVDEKRAPSFYQRMRFEHLERVVTFRIDRRRAPRIQRPDSLRFVPANPFDAATLDALIAIDHQAFPWIWWNSEAEFLVYGTMPGVELYIGYRDETPVSYVGMTIASGWGHIDRIAVDPAHQGTGLGLQTLAFAVERMGERGARSIGLSTQSTNERSQRLYRRFGFERMHDTDYDLWGDTVHRAPNLPLGDARDAEDRVGMAATGCREKALTPSPSPAPGEGSRRPGGDRFSGRGGEATHHDSSDEPGAGT